MLQACAISFSIADCRCRCRSTAASCCCARLVVLPTAEIIMFDDVVVVYKFLGDLMFYVTGDQDENEVGARLCAGRGSEGHPGTSCRQAAHATSCCRGATAAAE